MSTATAVSATLLAAEATDTPPKVQITMQAPGPGNNIAAKKAACAMENCRNRVITDFPQSFHKVLTCGTPLGRARFDRKSFDRNSFDQNSFDGKNQKKVWTHTDRKKTTLEKGTESFYTNLFHRKTCGTPLGRTWGLTNSPLIETTLTKIHLMEKTDRERIRF
jgi:hypothetical protein